MLLIYLVILHFMNHQRPWFQLKILIQSWQLKEYFSMVMVMTMLLYLVLAGIDQIRYIYIDLLCCCWLLL